MFAPLFDAIRQVTRSREYSGKIEDKTDIAYRVIADHIRCLTFAITDGAVPSNEGRGYVLRRILRRAVKYGRIDLGCDEPFMHRLVDIVVETMGDAFPELQKPGNAKRVAEILHDEEVSFGHTLERGIKLFNEATDVNPSARDSAHPTISADDAFTLYDTYGFPLDLTQLMAEERGMTVRHRGIRSADGRSP